MLEKVPFRRANGKPNIADVGEVVERADIPYIQLAASELNMAEGKTTYDVEIPKHGHWGSQGLPLPAHQHRIKIAGEWALDPSHDLSELVDRATEIKTDFSDLPQSLDDL